MQGIRLWLAAPGAFLLRHAAPRFSLLPSRDPLEENLETSGIQKAERRISRPIQSVAVYTTPSTRVK